MSARCVMVLGTTSGAGKSWLATALCRWYARQGLKVAPFKAQNMSNNARVVAGGEIGSAQYFQALAAGVQPDVRMNPLLLKPEKDTASQVVLLGQVDAELSRMAWRGRSASVWPVLARALDDLRADHDVVVIEGAGSPAEINLHDSDVVNMRVARHADARCLLVTDIDRGGAFAHLYGTWALLPEHERALIRGFVLNKFRGDPALLAPAPQKLQELTGIPVVGTLPMLRQHGLPEEDGVFDTNTAQGVGAADDAGRAFADWRTGKADTTSAPLTVAVIAYPRISNLDEFQPLRNVPGVAPDLGAHAGRLRRRRLPHSSRQQAHQQRPCLAARTATRRHGDGACRTGTARCWAFAAVCKCSAPPSSTRMASTAMRRGWACCRWTPYSSLPRPCCAPKPPGARSMAPGRRCPVSRVQGYEIHHGQTRPQQGMAQEASGVREAMPGGLAWQNAGGNVLGCYLHGLFEDPAVLHALFGATAPTLDNVFDGLADFLDLHLPARVLHDLAS